MPYFQRNPVEGLIDTVRSNVLTPGLPSRGPALPGAGNAAPRPPGKSAGTTGILEQASAVLASEQRSYAPATAAVLPASPAALVEPSQADRLREQIDGLIEQFVALAGETALRGGAAPTVTRAAGETAPSDASDCVMEPAPVLRPPTPVRPGGAAQIKVSLTNEDGHPALIAFLSTALLSEDGAQIPADRISFEPYEVALGPGATGKVVVRVAVPAQARCGVYSGLIRASQLDYLHAVLVVQVEEEPS